uniref:Uncharacterized protein n=1 Tax=Megaselia scalaris TaxID=36166 RepID=T1GZD7_MEGSC
MEKVLDLYLGKNHGSCGIPAELLKAARATFNRLSKISEEWNVSKISSVDCVCKSYRGNSLISVAYKILASNMSELSKPLIFIDFRQGYDLKLEMSFSSN